MKSGLNQKNGITGFVAGLVGAVLLLFVSWENNMALASWLAPVLLIFNFRNARRWLVTLPVAVLCVFAKVVAMHGGWDIDIFMELVFGILVTVPLIAALYLDRFLSMRLKPLAASVIFPAVYTLLDFLLSLIPVGMTFSVPYTMSRSLTLNQTASLFGSWSIGFLSLWTGSVLVTAINHGFNWRKIKNPVFVCLAVLLLVITYGSCRMVLFRPNSPTVKIGSITVPHDQDYWAITDNNTPAEGSEMIKEKMAQIEDALFRLSDQAVAAGSRIVFWSEGNCPLYEDQYDAFIKRAKEYARTNHIYFMPGLVVLNYNSQKNNNLAVMITPEGEIAYRYEKTISWYPSDSDGIIKAVDTPYGKIGAAICFDMDFPLFIHQAGGIDIMLVPAFDTQKISPYHTEGALLRGIEGGFSVIRQCNNGTSIAADYHGNILANQDFYTTAERVMISDVPTKGVSTLYEKTCEWLFLPSLLLMLALSFLFGREKSDRAE